MEHSCNDHNHHTQTGDLSKEMRLYSLATFVTSIVLVAQWYVAMRYGNIALLGDTIHVGADLMTHIGSLAVVVLLLFGFTQNQERNLRNLFGWLGIALLTFGVFHTSSEAFEHFLNPKNTANWIVFWVAVLGGLGNLIVHLMLHRVPRDLRTITHEILSAHVLADLLMSVAVAISVIVRILYAHHWYGFIYADPFAASLVALYMAFLVITLSYKIIRFG